MTDYGPPETIGGLRARGVGLWCWCEACHHQARFAAEAMPFPAALPVPAVARRLICSRCGGREIYARPDWQGPLYTPGTRAQANDSGTTSNGLR